jgi:hypothetical protein
MTHDLASIPTKLAHPSRPTHRWYFTTVGIVAIMIAVAGFAPSLVNPSARLGPVSLLVIIHALLCTAWLLLFLLQSWLIAARHTVAHRRLGFASISVALLMLVVGYFTVIEQTRRGYHLSGDLQTQGDPAGEAVFPLGDLAAFTILFVAGIWNRRRPDVHKRLMTIATIGGLMPAALGHFVGHNLRSMPAILVPMIAAAFLAPAVYDRIHSGRFHRVTLWGGVLLFIWANFRAAVIRPSAAWHDLVSWLVR